MPALNRNAVVASIQKQSTKQYWYWWGNSATLAMCCLGKARLPSTNQGALGRWMWCVWNEGDIRLHTKANVYNTVVITLLYAWKDRTIHSCHGKRSSQFFTHCLQVFTGTEGHDEISTDEISEYCQILQSPSGSLGHVSVTSKFKATSDGPHWQDTEIKDSKRNAVSSCLWPTISHRVQSWQPWLGQKASCAVPS